MVDFGTTVVVFVYPNPTGGRRFRDWVEGFGAPSNAGTGESSEITSTDVSNHDRGSTAFGETRLRFSVYLPMYL